MPNSSSFSAIATLSRTDREISSDWVPSRSVVSYRVTVFIRRPALPISSFSFDAPRSGGVPQSERSVEDADGELGVLLLDEDGDLDLRGGDPEDVDPLRRQRLEQLQRHAGMGAHRHADDGDLGDLVVPDDLLGPHFLRRLFRDLHRLLE